MAERQVIKVQKERFIWLSPLPRSPSLGRAATAAAGLSRRLLFSIFPPSISLSPPLCVSSRRGRHWSPARAKFPCLLRRSHFCFDALSFTRVQRRGTRPCQCGASLPGCGWQIEVSRDVHVTRRFLFDDSLFMWSGERAKNIETRIHVTGRPFGRWWHTWSRRGWGRICEPEGVKTTSVSFVAPCAHHFVEVLGGCDP